MVGTYLCLNYQTLLNSPQTTLSLNACAASSLLLSLIVKTPPKYRKFKLQSLLSDQLSPFVIPFKPRPSLAKLDSLLAPLSKDRLRGMLECLNPSDSAILKREPTRYLLVLLIYSLALRISLIKLSIAFFTTRPYSRDP